jgi:hypothetical protein
MLPVLEDLYTQMGFEFRASPGPCLAPERTSCSTSSRVPGRQRHERGCRLTVVATMAANYLTPALAASRARNTKPSPFAATSKAETSKHSKYDRPVASMNPPLKFVAIAFNDHGGIGFEFYSAVVKPYFEGLREKEEEAGGSGWDARKQKSEFLQRASLSITIVAKGNSRVLDCMRMLLSPMISSAASTTSCDTIVAAERCIPTHAPKCITARITALD